MCVTIQAHILLRDIGQIKCRTRQLFHCEHCQLDTNADGEQIPWSVSYLIVVWLVWRCNFRAADVTLFHHSVPPVHSVFATKEATGSIRWAKACWDQSRWTFFNLLLSFEFVEARQTYFPTLQVHLTFWWPRSTIPGNKSVTPIVKMVGLVRNNIRSSENKLTSTLISLSLQTLQSASSNFTDHYMK